MPRVQFNGTVRINLTGYDREAVTFEAGAYDVPERVAEWVRRNPSVGDVLDAPPEASAAAPDVAGAGAAPRQYVAPDFAALAVGELRERATRWGIEGAKSMKKAELVAALGEVGKK